MESVKYLVQSKVNNKLKFEYSKRQVVQPKTDANIEIPSEYKNEVMENDKTIIKSPSIKLCLYSSKDEQGTVIKANEFEIRIFNDDWYHAGKYIIAKQTISLEFSQAQIIADDDTVKEINKYVIKDEQCESFIAFEIKLKIIKSLPSK